MQCVVSGCQGSSSGSRARVSALTLIHKFAVTPAALRTPETRASSGKRCKRHRWPGRTSSNPGMAPCVCQGNSKALQSSRGRNLPMTSSSRRPNPSPSRSRRSRRSRQSRNRESQRRSLCSRESQRRTLERRRSRESRPRSLDSRLRVRSRSRPRSLEKRLVCPTGCFRGFLCRRDRTSPG